MNNGKQNNFSRQQILNWINIRVQSTVCKIQQLGTGVAYCELFDHYFKNSIPPSKIYRGKTQYDYINNLRLLQTAFSKTRIPISMDVIFQQDQQISFIKISKQLKIIQKSNDCQYIQPIARKKQCIQNQIRITPFTLDQSKQRKQGVLSVSRFAQKSVDRSSYMMNRSMTPSGKSSVSSQLFQGSDKLVIQRIKQILSRQNQSDQKKVKTLKLILNIKTKQNNNNNNNQKQNQIKINLSNQQNIQPNLFLESQL